jgi:putative ATP-dependent endonuclease of the OLD family
MRLTDVTIKNFRSCRDVQLEIGGMHALVGGNNAGKSTVLRALDFLFNPSAKSLNEESFWNKDTGLEIRVEAVFAELTDAEREALGPYLTPDGTFHMARTATIGTADDELGSDSVEDDDKIKISQYYMKPVPELEWLDESSITGKNIAEWWNARGELVVGGVNFANFMGAEKMPKVGEWKETASAFVAAHHAIVPMKDTWVENPKGYAGVLKGTLPFFVLVPAVRDVTEESKGTKSSPFGRLLFAILDNVAQEKKTEIRGILEEISKQMNRIGGDRRVALIAETEKQLNALLKDFFDECDLEIEFETPTLEVLMSAPKLYVDDGFRNAIENKGHGLQRAVIFTILRRYAEFMTTSQGGRKRKLILAVEEPEIYMHPQAQRTIRSVFRKIAGGGDQVIFSTHSSLLVDVSYFDEIVRLESVVMKVDEKKTTISKAYQLPMSKMIADLQCRHPSHADNVTDESMREHYSHAYNPRRSEGFFASRVILVEGLTEEYSLPVYAEAIPDCAFDPKGISIVECNGKGTMDRLFRIFNELHIPCYMLFDYDKGNANATIIDKSKELLQLAGEETAPPDELLVKDGVACFPNKWETDLKGETPDHDDLTREARQSLGLSGDNGKPLIARYIARKLTSREPRVVPPSVRTIIEKAGNVTWKGSCLKTPENAA